MLKKAILLLFMGLFLNSCVVSTAAKVVKTTTKVAVGAVKGTVNAVSWTVSKASGKIDDKRLNGTWRITEVYKGSFDDISKTGEGEDIYSNSCSSGSEILEFKAKKSKLKPVHCSEVKEKWESYKFKFGKNPETKERENYIKMASGEYISIINVSNKELILEGNLIPSYTLKGGRVYRLEKGK